MNPVRRSSWSIDKVIQVVNEYIEAHADFKAFKKSGKAKEFHQHISERLTIPTANGTENLLKNLGREYREHVKKTMESGSGTDDPVGLLRGSAELFTLYEQYLGLYFPAGGQIRPYAVLTEAGVVRPGEVGEHDDRDDDNTRDNIPSTSSSGPHHEANSASGSQKKKRKCKEEESDTKVMLAVMQSQLECFKEIATELKCMRMMMANQFGLQVVLQDDNEQ